ncbi:hypothetical protein [Undibacterium sp. TS12]|uniref:hypothetical protein n=1 Tax=Undibacterium sp. TS12 TaxID=2908202 RepID=UPI001F4D2166|nr:hypothetical protein [Undibacterium sp. TS12]MCH8620787.1 hypothetical protein [Undibacterium sp. TS12]
MQSTSLQCMRHRSVHRSILCSLLTAVSLGLANPGVMAQSISTEAKAASNQAGPVLAAAQRDFTLFAQHHLQTRSGGGAGVPAGFPLDINDWQDLKDAKAVYGFPVYSVDPNDLLAGRSDLRSMAKPNGQWRVLISVGDRPVGLATLEQSNGRWEVISYGAAVLAKDVDASMGVHANASRSNVRFIRIYQAKSDLLEVVSANDGYARFMPLYSARTSLSLKQRSLNAPDAATDQVSLMEGADLVQSLRAVVKTNMDNFR